jgi:hypothetical protein
MSSFQPTRDLLDMLRKTLRKLDMEPDRDRPALAEFKRIVQNRLSKIQDTGAPGLEDWNRAPFESDRNHQIRGH